MASVSLGVGTDLLTHLLPAKGKGGQAFGPAEEESETNTWTTNQ